MLIYSKKKKKAQINAIPVLYKNFLKFLLKFSIIVYKKSTKEFCEGLQKILNTANNSKFYEILYATTNNNNI